MNKPVIKKKIPNKVVFDATSEKIVWELGLVFGSVEEFRVAVTKYAVQDHIQIEKYVNEPGRVRVRCCKKTCPWLLCASKDKTSGDFIVKRYNPIHKCLTSTHNYLCMQLKVFGHQIQRKNNSTAKHQHCVVTRHY